MKTTLKEIHEYYRVGWDHMLGFEKFFYLIYTVVIGLNLIISDSVFLWKMLTVACFIGWFVSAIGTGVVRNLYEEMSDLQSRTSNLLDEVIAKFVAPTRSTQNEKGH